MVLRDRLAAGLRRLPALKGKARIGETLGRWFPRGEAVARMRDGSVLVLDLDVPIERWAYWTGVYDAIQIERLLAALPAHGVAVDVGANVGLYSVPLARRGRVVAIEAMPANATRLRVNLAANGLEEVSTVVQCAVGDHVGEVLLRGERQAGLSGNAAATTAEDDRTVRVPLRTFDAIAEEIGLESCDVVKIDIEGMELAALRGGQRIFKTARVIQLELNEAHMKAAGWELGDLRGLAEDWGFELRVESGGIGEAWLTKRRSAARVST